jgi:hypothetical protein
VWLSVGMALRLGSSVRLSPSQHIPIGPHAKFCNRSDFVSPVPPIPCRLYRADVRDLVDLNSAYWRVDALTAARRHTVFWDLFTLDTWTVSFLALSFLR